MAFVWPLKSEGLLNFFFLIKLKLIYTVLVSGVQQSDLDTHTHTHTHTHIFSFTFFSIIGYYEILSAVPCAIP